MEVLLQKSNKIVRLSTFLKDGHMSLYKIAHGEYSHGGLVVLCLSCFIVTMIVHIT